jgi:hypothetical protein
MRASNEKLVEVIDFVEKQVDKVTACGRMDGMYPVEDKECPLEK